MALFGALRKRSTHQQASGTYVGWYLGWRPLLLRAFVCVWLGRGRTPEDGTSGGNLITAVQDSVSAEANERVYPISCVSLFGSGLKLRC